MEAKVFDPGSIEQVFNTSFYTLPPFLGSCFCEKSDPTATRTLLFAGKGMNSRNTPTINDSLFRVSLRASFLLTNKQPTCIDCLTRRNSL
jgi:hypothetical protein